MRIFFEDEFSLGYRSDFGRRKIKEKPNPSDMEKNGLAGGEFSIPYKSLTDTTGLKLVSVKDADERP